MLFMSGARIQVAAPQRFFSPGVLPVLQDLMRLLNPQGLSCLPDMTPSGTPRKFKGGDPMRSVERTHQAFLDPPGTALHRAAQVLSSSRFHNLRAEAAPGAAIDHSDY